MRGRLSDNRTRQPADGPAEVGCGQRLGYLFDRMGRQEDVEAPESRAAEVQRGTLILRPVDVTRDREEIEGAEIGVEREVGA